MQYVSAPEVGAYMALRVCIYQVGRSVQTYYLCSYPFVRIALSRTGCRETRTLVDTRHWQGSRTACRLGRCGQGTIDGWSGYGRAMAGDFGKEW